MKFTDASWKDSDGYGVEVYQEGPTIQIRVVSPDGGKGEPSKLAEGLYVATLHSAVLPVYWDALRKAGKNPRDYRGVGFVVFRKAAEPFVAGIIKELTEQVEKDRTAKREELRRNVPGLEELRAAYNDVERFHREFDNMMDDESNDGARPPAPTKADPEALAKQYPVAAAYLKAESWSAASHYVKASAGEKARLRIAAGENHEVVIAEMEAEWSEHCTAHVWD